ncbi:hypothetical protein BH753_gp126 [Bacillus phage Shbh1]|uniref:Uncharacterized protein n=1 Tax=Bacillus phage Shbh1 TaxID=1796992 RepID=A0A142F1F1_9CAUD|nr:hypothetical protein BH753_gp126 [Bacillus phage Shbh1]AMQ66608.1 hypothetical protein [Bacillus phage Shbh1]
MPYSNLDLTINLVSVLDSGEGKYRVTAFFTQVFDVKEWTDHAARRCLSFKSLDPDAEGGETWIGVRASYYFTRNFYKVGDMLTSEEVEELENNNDLPESNRDQS